MESYKQVTIADQEFDLERAVAEALERFFTPIAEAVCELEVARRKEYLTEKEAALLFSLSPATLKTQRSRGGGPAYKKVGNKILYARSDLENFLNQPFASY
jgi:hypothetical protein